MVTPSEDRNNANDLTTLERAPAGGPPPQFFFSRLQVFGLQQGDIFSMQVLSSQDAEGGVVRVSRLGQDRGQDLRERPDLSGSS